MERFKRILFKSLVLAAFSPLLLGAACHHGPPSSDLPVVQLEMDGHKVWVEVANHMATRTTGLMFRRQMDPDNGMLFVFPDIDQRYFWMKNTLIPLSIAFIDEKGTILNILEMPPETEQTFPSKGPAKFALEMNAGWFTKAGVKEGEKVGGILAAPKAED